MHHSNFLGKIYAQCIHNETKYGIAVCMHEQLLHRLQPFFFPRKERYAHFMNIFDTMRQHGMAGVTRMNYMTGHCTLCSAEWSGMHPRFQVSFFCQPTAIISGVTFCCWLFCIQARHTSVPVTLPCCYSSTAHGSTAAARAGQNRACSENAQCTSQPHLFRSLHM